MKNKKKWLAVLLNFIFPGAGQVYIGQKKKGIALLIFTIAMSIITTASPNVLTSIGLLIGYFYSIVSVIIAFKNNEMGQGS